MKISIGNFTKFEIKKTKEEISSILFEIGIENKFFKHNSKIDISLIELKKINLYAERLLKNKIKENENIYFTNNEMYMQFIQGNNRIILNWQFHIKNDNGEVVSYYTLKFEREDIIALYVFLCEILNLQNKFKLPDDYKYMYLHVRYLDIDTVKQFYYLSDDSSIRVGDYVLVNRAGEESVAIVEQVEYYTKEEAPYPVDKTKEIIRRVDRNELKSDDGYDYDKEESYITVKEAKELTNNIKTLKDIIKKQGMKLSIKELMKQISRDNIYADVYYYPKLNLFIENVSTIYFLPQYGQMIFSKEEFKEMKKNSIRIFGRQSNNLNDIYNFAISICQDNNIEYENDYKNETIRLKNDICKVTKITRGQEEITDNFYYHVCEKNYTDLGVYIRDTDVNERNYNFYKENVGNIIGEKKLVLCTNKVGGMIKDTRFFILSNDAKELSIFEEITDWGLNVIKEDSRYKILEVGEINNKKYVILLHIVNSDAGFLKELHTNVDDVIKEECKSIMEKTIKEEHISALDELWYDRTQALIGINEDEIFNKGEKTC